MLARIRPAEDAFIEYSIERPYEVHLGEFETEEDFNAFLADEERNKFIEMKNKAIRFSILVTGKKA